MTSFNRPQIPDLKTNTIQLPDKPTANLSYTYLAPPTPSRALLLFLNGLVMPQASWLQVISLLPQNLQSQNLPQPHILTYDRYGQGNSSPHPFGIHDIPSCIHDLCTFLTLVSVKEMGFDVCNTNDKETKIVIVGNSIGCPMARIFAQRYPHMVSGFVFLDSMVANTDFVSMFPDPDGHDFEERKLPEEVTKEEIKRAREVYGGMFGPKVVNKEQLDRSDMQDLLPQSDGPGLKGRDGKGAWVTVIGHGWEKFAVENEMKLGFSKHLINAYVNTAWHEYNKGLVRLTDEGRGKGPIVVEDASHFVQVDTPGIVCEEICDMLRRVDGAVV